ALGAGVLAVLGLGFLVLYLNRTQPGHLNDARGVSSQPLSERDQFLQVLSDHFAAESSTLPPRGQEALHGDGYASPEEGVDQLVRGVLTLDADGYRPWLAAVPEEAARFDRLVDLEARTSKRDRDFAAKQQPEKVRNDWIEGRTRRSAAIPDGDGYANVFL